MYFTNITNSELVQYHKSIKNNFSMGLSEVLTSDLFKVETIITDKIYKIYPLFYCEMISSTNPNDIILNSNALLCEKNTSTRLYFNSIKQTKEFELDLLSATVFHLGGIIYNRINNEVLGGAKLIYYLTSTNEDVYTFISDKDGVVYDDIKIEKPFDRVYLEYEGVRKLYFVF